MKEMTHVERVSASLNDEKVDRLPVYPIACGICRKLIGDGRITYREWCNDPKLFAQAFLEGQKEFGMDLAIGLMDLSVMAGDLGAHVRMDEENTPFVDKHIVHSLEDYEKLEVPDIKKGRTGVLIEGTKLIADYLKGTVVTSSFIEGPLLALSQTAGAERLFMDMFMEPAPVHKALEVMTEYDSQVIDAFAETGIEAICWDYLWGNYAVLGDSEYNEFESKYAKRLNQQVLDNGMAVAIHNCADLPHLDTQIKEFKPSIYSMAYYPQIEGSPDAVEVIDRGYADKCLIAGQLDPQLFMRSTKEQVITATKDLCQDVKTALCKRGLNSRYCLSTGCEIPPDINTKMENIKAMVDASNKYSRMDC
ncbi:MAG TPA: uroporphyrinogen decarboxylase family protein [Mobilitalea sp.]|nr:uroporphyrinogen decarboxylase family protein [Mobilitalea sp.]